MADSDQVPGPAGLGEERLAQWQREQSQAFSALQAQLSAEIRKEFHNCTRQIEAHQALQALVGDVPGSLHGWPVSADFALHLVRLIRTHSYDLILEFGSGTSTFLILRALELFSPESPADRISQPRLISLEHLQEFRQNTEDLVANCRNRQQLELRLSPLEPWQDLSGNYRFYPAFAVIVDALQSLAPNPVQNGFAPPHRLLVVVDGPPGDSCPWARYPALPTVLNAASGLNVAIDLLLDDFNRPDEQAIAQAWQQAIADLGIEYRSHHLPLEKGGLLLRLRSTAGVDTSAFRWNQSLAARRYRQQLAASSRSLEEFLVELEALRQSMARPLAEAGDAPQSQRMESIGETPPALDGFPVHAVGPGELPADAGRDPLPNPSPGTDLSERLQRLEEVAAALKVQLFTVQEWLQAPPPSVSGIALSPRENPARSDGEPGGPPPPPGGFLAEARQRDRRELALLRKECARRYSLLQCRDEQLQEQSERLREQMEQMTQLRSEVARLRELLAGPPAEREPVHARPQPLSGLPGATTNERPADEPGPAVDVRALQHELQQARDDGELLSLQLQQVREELARSRSQPRPTAEGSARAVQTPQDPGSTAGAPADADTINAFRRRLLAQG